MRNRGLTCKLISAGVFGYLLLTIASAPLIRAQSSGAAADWEKAAGGKMSFDVASVRPSQPGAGPQARHSNVPLGPMDSFSPTGGLLEATDYPLYAYIIFAYKPTSTQVQSIQSQLPKWATTSHYDIVARASGNPTKDQFRLMMQSLLAARFRLAVHHETKQTPVLALVMATPGKFGPHLQLHPADAPCSTANVNAGDTITGGYPVHCGVIIPTTLSSPHAAATGRISVGARDVSMMMLANIISSQPMININKPVIDKTGIIGNVDFVMEFSPDVPPGLGFTPDPNGPTFLEALKDQLGIKLEQQTASVDSIVVDHIEEPTPN